MVRLHAALCLFSCLALPALDAPQVAGAGGKEPGKAGGGPTDLHEDLLPEGAVARLGTVRLRHGGGIHALAFAPDGTALASAGNDALIRLWDPGTGKEQRVLVGSHNSVHALAFSPRSKMLASAGRDKAIRLWELSTGRERLEIVTPWDLIQDIAFAPDGKQVAACGSGGRQLDSSVCCWSALDGKLVRALTGHTGQVRAVAYSADGKLMASASQDGTLRVWDAAAGRELRRAEGLGFGVLTVAFSPDGHTLASGGTDRQVRLWDVATAKPLHTLEDHTAAVHSVRFSPDGKLLASASQDGTVRLWDPATGKPVRTLRVEGAAFTTLAFAPDGKTLAASGTWHHAVHTWDVATGKNVSPVEGHDARVTSIAFSNDGRTAVTGNWDGTARFWDAATGKELRSLRTGQRTIAAVALAPDGRRLASAGQVPLDPNQEKSGLAGEVRLWDADDGKLLHKLAAHKARVTCVAFAPDGKTLASAGHDKLICLWDAATGKLLRKLAGHDFHVLALAFAPDGKTLASAGADKTVRVWNVGTGKELLELHGHGRAVACVAFSPDGKLLASGAADPFARNNSIILWDAASGKEVRRLLGHPNEVAGLAFSLDGKVLVSANSSVGVQVGGKKSLESEGNYTIHLWEVGTGKELRKLRGHRGWVTAVSFSPNGKTLASGSWDTTALIWQVDTGTAAEVRPAPPKEEKKPPARQLPRGAVLRWTHPGGLNAIALAPDGKLLASAGSAGPIHLWDTASGAEVRQFLGHVKDVHDLAFSPDGKVLASAAGFQSGGDLTVRTWDVASGKKLFKFEGHEQRVRSVAFAPDGKTLASGDDCGSIRVWDAASGTQRYQLPGNQRTVRGTVVRFAPGGKWLASAGGDALVRLWDVATGAAGRRMPGHRSAASCLAFSPDGLLLASGSGWMNDAPRVWEVATGWELLQLRRPGTSPFACSAIAFSPDVKILAVGGPGSAITFWEVSSGRAIAELKGHRLGVCGLQFAPGGKHLISAGSEGSILVWDLTEPAVWGLQPRAAELEPGELAVLWADLSGEDASRAYWGVRTLAAAPRQAVAFLKDRLRPAAVNEGDRIRRLIRDLDSNKFAVRQAASRELTKQGAVAERFLRQALVAGTGEELRRRILGILEVVKGNPNVQPGEVTGEALRTVRAIQILEAIGDEDARGILMALSRGAAGAVETRDAQAALERLARQAKAP